MTARKVQKSPKRLVPPKPSFVDDVLKPVDPEIFIFVSLTYSAAAQLTMPVENPGARSVLQHQGKAYSFADIPLNRGMLAAKKQLADIKASNHEAYLCRLMHFGELLEAREKFGDLIRDDRGDGSLMVSEAVMFAAATATLKIDGDHIGFDIEDAVKVAQSFAIAHPD